jgi:hypothetical protein
MNNVIISPHCDDEIIGNFSILEKSEELIIVYTDLVEEKRRIESLNLRKLFNIEDQIFSKKIPDLFLSKDRILYFPDPFFETHPAHRAIGAIGEELLRKGCNVIFYNTTMTAPYIFEVKNWKEKEDLLNRIYPSQNSLWEYDHRYFLFEGQCKWIV